MFTVFMIHIPLLFRCHHCPIRPPVLPINPTYIAIPFATLLSILALYKLLTFHVQNLMSIFSTYVVYPNNLFKSEGLCDILWKNYFLGWGIGSLTPNPQAGGTTFLGCPQLHIQYILIYHPYLEALLSIRSLRSRHAVVKRDPHNMGKRH
jgi:hypothetical protein